MSYVDIICLKNEKYFGDVPRRRSCDNNFVLAKRDKKNNKNKKQGIFSKFLSEIRINLTNLHRQKK